MLSIDNKKPINLNEEVHDDSVCICIAEMLKYYRTNSVRHFFCHLTDAFFKIKSRGSPGQKKNR